ncbi:MAG: hypothetical protein WBX25_01805 [Rhodomicrobium sp.]
MAEWAPGFFVASAQRYHLLMLQFDSDLAEEWVLKLWEAAPIPANAARLRQAEVEKLLKRHRIRRIGAAEVLAILKQPPPIVAPGVTGAAVAHIRVLIESSGAQSRKVNLVRSGRTGRRRSLISPNVDIDDVESWSRLSISSINI